MTKEQLYEEWHPIIRNYLKRYISTHKALAFSYEDLYQECFATFLRLKQNNPDFRLNYYDVMTVVRKYFLASKIFTVHDVNNIDASAVGKKIDAACDRGRDFSEFINVEDKSLSNTYNDVDTMVDWNHFCEIQGEIDSKILLMKSKGMTNVSIAKELGISSPAVLKRLRKLNTKYHEWLEAS